MWQSAFVSTVAGLTLATAPWVASAEVILTDTFDGPDGTDVATDPASRQFGPLGSVGYASSQGATLSGGNMMLSGFAFAGLDLDLASLPGPVTIGFDAAVSDAQSTDDTNWWSLTLSDDASSPNITNSGAELGFLVRANGGTEIFEPFPNGGTGPSLPGAYGFDTFSHFDVVFTDSSGTGSAFDGDETVVQLFQDGSLVFQQALFTPMTSGYFALGATSEAWIENLTVSVVPEPASLGLLGLAAVACCGRRRRA